MDRARKNNIRTIWIEQERTILIEQERRNFITVGKKILEKYGNIKKEQY